LKRENEYNVSFYKTGGEVKELLVESNSILNIKFRAIPTYGHHWVFLNKNEIEQSDAIKYLNSTYVSSCEKEVTCYRSTQIITIYIKDVIKEFSEIKFLFKRQSEETTTYSPLDVSTVILKPSNPSSSYPNPIPNPTPSSTPNPVENEFDLSDITIKTNKILLITFSLLLLFIFH